MSVAMPASSAGGIPLAGSSGFWDRRLTRYPERGRRYALLALVSVITITLYWQLYTLGADSTKLLPQTGMTFSFFVTMVAVATGFAGFGSVLAGLLDRWGRANLVVIGLTLTTLIVLVALPLSTTKWSFVISYAVLGYVEGVLLVATAALVRDFSPQVGRASAMALWTLGPVIGSIVVTKLANATLDTYHTWQSQYIICGIASVIVTLFAVAFLRELHQNLRDQLMVELEDKRVIELKAARGEVSHEHGGAALKHILRPRILTSALAISLYLALYYTLTVLLVALLATTFGYSPAKANGLGTWLWASMAVALVLVGFGSDRVGVRKPFMLIGAVATAGATILILGKLGHPATSYDTLRWLMIALGAALGITYAPWMAAFTETIEDVHPALTASGLAVWGWIIRSTVMVLLIVLPNVVTNMNTVIDKGPVIQAQEAALTAEKNTLTSQGRQLAARGATLKAQGAKLLAAQQAVAASGTRPTAAQLAVGQAIAQRLRAQSAVLTSEAAALQAKGSALKARAAVFLPQAAKVQQAVKDVPGQWKTWLWICVLCQLLFIPAIFLMHGRWTSKAAKEDLARHERSLEQELSRLAGAATA
jgi:hypothetical protein